MAVSSEDKHVPVLLEQSIDLLNVQAGLTYVDATAGSGGHLREIIKRVDTADNTNRKKGNTILSEKGTVIGLDRDADAIVQLQAEIGDGAKLIHANFREIGEVLHDLGISTVNGGIIADLGLSSMQLADAQRGFSFMKDGPLDMRADRSQELTAQELINNLSEQELREIIFKLGEERYSRKIAREIVRLRPLRTTGELADLVSRCIPRRHLKERKSSATSHPATRTFQALRMAVNDELGNLQRFLREALAILTPGARLVVITFHSLEDRLVKQFFRQASLDCICPPRQPVCTCKHRRQLLIITPKPIVAGKEEVLANIRSRSAKLRAGEKLV